MQKSSCECADVLVRVNRGSLPIFFEDEPIELMPWLRLLPGHHAHEIPVVVHDKERDQKIAGRLVVRSVGQRHIPLSMARWSATNFASRKFSIG